jgi:hypothetical protein
MIIVASIIGMIVAAVMIIRAPGILVTVIHIRMLHIAAAAAADEDAGMISTLDHYVPASIETVVNVHAAPVVMEPGDVSVRTPGNGAIPGLHGGVAARGRTAMSARGPAVGRGGVAVCASPAGRAVRSAGPSSGAGVTGGRTCCAVRAGRGTGGV